MGDALAKKVTELIDRAGGLGDVMATEQVMLWAVTENRCPTKPDLASAY